MKGRKFTHLNASGWKTDRINHSKITLHQRKIQNNTHVVDPLHRHYSTLPCWAMEEHFIALATIFSQSARTREIFAKLLPLKTTKPPRHNAERVIPSPRCRQRAGNSNQGATWKTREALGQASRRKNVYEIILIQIFFN